MDLTLQQSELTKALSVTQSIIERKSTMPILSNVMLSATDNQLKISATDFENTAMVSVRASILSTGSTTVNAKVLTEIVRELPEGEISLKLGEGERLEIIAKNSRVRVIGVSAEEYPSLPGLAAKVSGRVSSKSFLEMVNKTLYSVSQDETRFNLNGVCFEIQDKGKKSANLKMVATDGHRLAMITRPVSNLDFEGKVIVPKKGLSEVRKILDAESDREIGIDIREGFLIVETESTKMSMRLIDGEFPDYNQVLPKKKGVVLKTQAGTLAQALRRVVVMVTDKNKGVRFDLAKNTLRITSSSPELGDAREEMQVEYAGESIGIGFNARYLLDFSLSLEENQNIITELNGELGPGKFMAEGDESYVGIIMPMRLDPQSKPA